MSFVLLSSIFIIYVFILPIHKSDNSTNNIAIYIVYYSLKFNQVFYNRYTSIKDKHNRSDYEVVIGNERLILMKNCHYKL